MSFKRSIRDFKANIRKWPTINKNFYRKISSRVYE